MFCVGLTLCLSVSNAQAKEKTLSLIIENQTGYTISTQYKISRTDYVYANGVINNLPNGEEHTIVATNVGQGYTPSAVLIPTLEHENVTVFGGNCTQYFNKNEMRVIIHFMGDPKTTGKFECVFG